LRELETSSLTIIPKGTAVSMSKKCSLPDP
jgi:hypothetical protein